MSRPRPFGRSAVAAATLLLAIACADAEIAAPPAPRFDVDVNDPRGELIVEIRYDGRFYDAASPVADNE